MENKISFRSWLKQEMTEHGLSEKEMESVVDLLDKDRKLVRPENRPDFYLAVKKIKPTAGRRSSVLQAFAEEKLEEIRKKVAESRRSKTVETVRITEADRAKAAAERRMYFAEKYNNQPLVPKREKAPAVLDHKAAAKKRREELLANKSTTQGGNVQRISNRTLLKRQSEKLRAEQAWLEKVREKIRQENAGKAAGLPVSAKNVILGASRLISKEKDIVENGA